MRACVIIYGGIRRVYKSIEFSGNQTRKFTMDTRLSFLPPHLRAIIREPWYEAMLLSASLSDTTYLHHIS